MLFFKLYNWLKYKTFPSSFSFKNRLYIERDSKNRRVVNNFGLIFRNSKWSNYEVRNVLIEFKNTYVSFFKLYAVLFVVYYVLLYCSFFDNYYVSYICFFFWFALDMVEYYSSFAIWMVLTFISSSLSRVYVLINDYRELFKKYKFGPKNERFTISICWVKNAKKGKNANLSSNDLNWVTYSWFTNNLVLEFNLDYSLDDFFEGFFDLNIPKTFWNSSYNFFTNLYKSMFFLNSNDAFSNAPHPKELPKINPFNLNFSNLIDNERKNNSFFLWTSLVFNKNSNLNNFLLNSFSQKVWSSDSFFLENLNFFSLNYIKGNFFLKNTFFINNLNFFFLQNSFNSKILFSKWNRWLYRYSLLHRKSIKFFQKLTFTKRLMNSNFYNSSIFKKNLWNSVYFNKKNLNEKQITTFFDSYFNDFYRINTKDFFFNRQTLTSFFFSNKLNFNNFNFFENTYIWNLKRFFIFNSLKNNNYFNFFNFKKMYDKGAISDDFNELDKLNNFYLNLFDNNRNFYLNSIYLGTYPIINGKNNFFDNLHEDFNFIFSDLDIFSKDNLFFFSNLSLNSNLYLNNSFFENYFDNNVFFANWSKPQRFFVDFRNLFSDNKCTYRYLPSLFFTDISLSSMNNNFFKDIYLLNLFIK